LNEIAASEKQCRRREPCGTKPWPFGTLSQIISSFFNNFDIFVSWAQWFAWPLSCFTQLWDLCALVSLNPDGFWRLGGAYKSGLRGYAAF
jgi:hypothetical protein